MFKEEITNSSRNTEDEGNFPTHFEASITLMTKPDNYKKRKRLIFFMNTDGKILREIVIH